MKINRIENHIYVGNSLQLLQNIPENSIDCIVTSPPYYGQRDYGVDGQIGNEKEPLEYINNLVLIFNECKRVLKSTGTFWLNLGDKYHNGNLLGMPWRVALALQDHGWILRNDIIWHKPNAMPHSAKNRLTVDHEYIFFFTLQNKDYYFNQDVIREEHVTFSEKSKMKGGRNHFGKKGGTPELGKNGGNSNLHTGRWDQAFHPKGRNKRTVWNVSLSKFRGAHFAVFPEKLIEPCILSGCPENGIVLDPFFGAGTTGYVAQNNNRKYLGLEISPVFAEIAKERFNECKLVLPKILEDCY
ncbi:site-specific DNA-methyltransferase [Legionella pneumophila serogroup 1]|nr:site-specific DNA-methyltransferase [Legionella pneumophila]HAU1316073.1 site-specific DNA-methyltransferase [Legionella pneumophila]HBI5778507.1 site-specific DNA-methyltransferase [Legionella pneumophila]HBJ7666212.1 site-specific DNA-methyltransferase [Legionella pneumophila]HDU8068258.1 site-specific DNA-methyltransferase [Legionella pneumophila]